MTGCAAPNIKSNWNIGHPLFSAIIDNNLSYFSIKRNGPKFLINHNGSSSELLVFSKRHAELNEIMIPRKKEDLSRLLLAPMPGLLVSLLVKEKQVVDENQPLEVQGSIVHNDFKYDNLVLDKDNHSKITAVLDWEMATIGDPFMDLGTTLGYWVDNNDLPELKLFQLSATTLDGNPTREGILELYEKESGKNITNPVFYYVFGLFKIAVIAQQIYFRYKKTSTTTIQRLNASM